MALASFVYDGAVTPPAQPLTGPGGATYVTDSIRIYDFAKRSDGYYLYEPELAEGDSAHVVVFIHGYGALNPLIYGGWIRHLVQKGNIVIWPRYQRNIFWPRTQQFTKNVVKALKHAQKELQKPGHVKPIWDKLALAGHSYGGVLAANLGVRYKEFDLPKPAALLMVSPGTGPLTGGRLDSYEGLDPDLKVVTTVSENDFVVGDAFAIRFFSQAVNTPNRNLLRQYADYRPGFRLTAGHNECYALDEFFDNGVRNGTTRRALYMGKTDAVDYFGYWKLLDGLLESTRNNQYEGYALGNTSEQRYLGTWSDGTPVRPFDVFVPDQLAKK